jgi:hypothetical protein
MTATGPGGDEGPYPNRVRRATHLGLQIRAYSSISRSFCSSRSISARILLTAASSQAASRNFRRHSRICIANSTRSFSDRTAGIPNVFLLRRGKPKLVQSTCHQRKTRPSGRAERQYISRIGNGSLEQVAHTPVGPIVYLGTPLGVALKSWSRRFHEPIVLEDGKHTPDAAAGDTVSGEDRSQGRSEARDGDERGRSSHAISRAKLPHVLCACCHTAGDPSQRRARHQSGSQRPSLGKTQVEARPIKPFRRSSQKSPESHSHPVFIGAAAPMAVTPHTSPHGDQPQPLIQGGAKF